MHKNLQMSKEKLTRLKKITGIAVLLLILIFLTVVNVTEIKKGNSTNRTVAGSSFGDLDYFTDFSLTAFDGNIFQSKDMADYQVIAVNVWEPYCTSCLKELPELDKLAKEYKEKGLLIIALQGNAYVYPEDVALGDKLIGEMNLSIPVLYADQKFTEEVLPYLNNSFPGTWIIDSEGNVLDMAFSAKSKDAWAEYFDQFL